MSKMAVSPFSILSKEQKSEFYFEIEEAIFVAAVSSEHPALGFYCQRNEIQESRFHKCIREIGSAFSGKDFSFKIVGHPAGVILAKKEIEKMDYCIANTAPREGKLDVVFIPNESRLRIALTGEPAAVKPKTKSLNEKIKVLIVDDSKTVRHLLTKVLSADPKIQVVGQAEVPSQVDELIRKHAPDVITLDIHMPEMDGVTLLKQIHPKYKIPTVMISSISMEEGPMVLNALESGAIDYIQKPTLEQLQHVGPLIIEKVKMASLVQVKVRKPRSSAPVKKVVKPKIGTAHWDKKTVICIGSSTGGTEALKEVFTHLPPEIPPIIVVQHIPPVFSRAFAERVNDLCPFEVKEARDGDEVLPNRVLIAPGGFQMRVKRNSSGQMVIVVEDAPPVNRHKPSVDFLFDSAAEVIGKNAISVILTGMGADGAKGMQKMKVAGARTVGQNEETCVVYGMPQAAYKLGCVDHVLPIEEVAGKLIELSKEKKKAA
jgi:two-component system chemotaxis response regulator CheB